AAEFGDVCSHDIRPLDHTFGASDNQHKHQYDNEFRPANPQNIHTSNSPSIFSARSWRIVSASDASLPSTPLTNPIEDSALNPRARPTASSITTLTGAFSSTANSSTAIRRILRSSAAL